MPAVLKTTKPRPNYRPLEERKCPVPGCDSKGHLSGKKFPEFKFMSIRKRVFLSSVLKNTFEI